MAESLHFRSEVTDEPEVAEAQVINNEHAISKKKNK